MWTCVWSTRQYSKPAVMLNAASCRAGHSRGHVPGSAAVCLLVLRQLLGEQGQHRFTGSGDDVGRDQLP
jgi:hypothetical protein